MHIPDVASRLLSVLEPSALLVGLFDPTDSLAHANAAYADAFLRGLAPPVSFADILRHGFRHGFGVRVDCGDVEQFLADVLPRRHAAPSRTLVSDLVDGRWVLFTQTRVDDWSLDIGTDISHLKQHEHRIALAHASAVHAALTDPLTSVSNRRHILELAATALADSQRERVPMCVVLVDLDHFKRINDTHGHHTGDQVLIEFCAQCRVHLRPIDSLGRMGGEEFLLVLRDVTAPVAASVMERLREFARGAGPVPCTFSGGIAQPCAGETLDALLRRADAALYAAKAAGRDCFVVSAEPSAIIVPEAPP
jgi:diguanylate cyclase (GGDEF)-like protein